MTLAIVGGVLLIANAGYAKDAAGYPNRPVGLAGMGPYLLVGPGS